VSPPELADGAKIQPVQGRHGLKVQPFLAGLRDPFPTAS
jgi:hypothetical protein